MELSGCLLTCESALIFLLIFSWRVVSNFGDGDCGVGEIYTRVRAKFREDATRGERQKLETTDLAREFDLSRPSDFEV